MTKAKLQTAVDASKAETREALQTLFDNVNKGQKKQLVKIETIKAMFDRFGVNYDGY